MTQAVSNNLNNLQELMTQANQLQNKVTEVKEVSTVDKASDKLVDFSKVYEKQVSKENKNDNNVNIDNNVKVDDNISNLKTIADLKNNTFTQAKDTNWADFQAILSKITEESNAETSLDLTLARDIEEIISQLKEAIDETVDETEDVVEQTSVVEEAVVQVLDEKLLIEEALENGSDSLANDDKVQTGLSKDIAEELVTFVNNSVSNEIENSEMVLEENQAIEFDSLGTSFESLDMFNNLTAEDTVKTNKTEEASQNELEKILDEDVLKELNIESIKAEVDSSGQESSLMNSQTPQEQAVKAMLNTEIEHFELKIDKPTEIQQVQTATSKPVDVSPSKILDQITKQMEGLQNNSKVNIVLNPESLGKVTIQLIKTGEGLSAQFTVANQEVRDMLMKGLDGLKETLTAHGVGVENVSVKMNEPQKSEYNPDWTEQEDSKGGNKEQGRSNKEEKEKGLFEQMMAQTLEEENGNV